MLPDAAGHGLRRDGTPTDGHRSGAIGFIGVAFGLSWLLWLVAIHADGREEWLNLGTGGPAVAAVLLSWTRRRGPRHPLWPRALLLVGLAIACWLVLVARAVSHGSAAGRAAAAPLLIVPALLPAWLLWSAWSANEGVASLLCRLVHAPDRWTLCGPAIFAILLGLPTLLAAARGLPLVWPTAQGSAPVLVATALAFFAFNFLFVGVLEEPGWRGLLLDRLLARYSPLWASMLVWVPWAIWHAPLDYYRPVRFSLVTYLLLRVVFMIPITIILTWLYRRSRRSIQATAVFHATMNTYPFAVSYYPPAMVLLIAFAAYAVVADRMWSRAWGPSTPTREVR